MKITPKPFVAIHCRSDMGPAFGDALLYDLVVWNVNNLSGLDLGHGFTCPENVNRNTYFTGGSPFEVSELEVFKVSL